MEMEMDVAGLQYRYMLKTRPWRVQMITNTQPSSKEQSTPQALTFLNETPGTITKPGVDPSSCKVSKTRLGKPKVRSGCSTCRLRRVKCDESRPHCQRCKNFGVICDGYPTKAGRVVAPVTERRIFPHLQPKPPMQLPRHGISVARFESDQELRFFQLFQEETAGQIAGPLKSSLWGRLVPQASESKPFVRHAMIAIAAMSKVSRDSRNSQPSCKTQNLGWERQYALKQYGMALKGMRDATTRDEHDLRTSLIACLLAFCFESLSCQERPARALALSGLTLFHQRANRRHMTFANSWKSSCLLDAELVSAFASLDIQVLCFQDDRPLSLHQQIIDEATEALKAMPLKFTSLEEANGFWQIMIRRNLHLKAKGKSDGKQAELGAKWESLGQAADFPTGQLHFSKLREHSAEIQGECQRCINDIHKWTKASLEVFKSVTRTDHKWSVIASLLQIHAKASLIALASMTFSSETSFDVFLPDFRAITNLAISIHPQLVESSQKSGVHHVDLGIVPALYLVATRCRDKVVRAKAIDLLYSIPYREGIWDSISTAHVSNWIRSIEVNSNGGNEDDIPEYNRVISGSTNLDMYSRTAKVYCTQRKGPTDADLVFHEGFLSW